MVLLLWAALSLQTAAPDAGKVDFSRDIRPILANNCILCHGPDPKARKAKLRLDSREGALELRDGTAAVVPGKPDQSELYRRVSSPDAEEVMPPAKTGKKLTREQIGLLRRWVEQGAPWGRHWSFVKPERPALPEVRDAKWLRNEVDRFILARLEREGLRPSAEADRRALVRRASLDLTGLPPTIDEADRFANDGDAAAYEKLVDRLLASPAFGERWAKPWLDLARYADSQGYAEDRPRTIWAWREWVIRALNENMPYDRFTVEQIAGDLLPGAGEPQLYATAFHRNTLTNTEGGTDDEEFRSIAVVDRVNTTMQAWMGLTLNCAQCHDHKFDPFTQEEYFRLFAFFNNTEDSDRGDDAPFLPVYTEEQKRRRREAETEIARLEESLKESGPELEAARKEWAAALLKPAEWKPPGPGPAKIAAVRVDAPAGFQPKKAELRLQSGSSKPLTGRIVRVELPGKQKWLHMAEVQVWSGGANVAPKGKAKQSSTAFEGAASRAIDGNTNGDYFGANSTTHTEQEDNPWWEVDLGRAMPIERIVVWGRTDGGAEIMNRLKGLRVRLPGDARQSASEKTFDAAPAPSAEWRLDGGRTSALRSVRLPDLVLVPEKPLEVPVGAEVIFQLEPAAPGLKLSITADPRVAELAELPEDVRAALGKPGDAKVAAHYRTIAPALKTARDRVAALRKELEGKPPATVPVMRELAEGKRRKTHIHVRGNFLVKGAEVSEGVPAAFPPLDGGPANRLALARWLVHPENPLTARVTVNRFWEQLFGSGLVSTSEDFGIRGEIPSHPGLLDWLASDFVSRKWDVKALIRLLATSAAYRQSSRVTPDLLARDPSNRLLARGPRVRISAESVRDQALFVSGLLSPKIGGPSVYPPQPKTGLTAAFSSSIDWETSKGEDRHRRGIYTFWRRTVCYPSMATFDAPDRNVCTVRRIPTNTPLQALVTMNDPVYVECSQALGRRMAAGGGAAHGFKLALSREPAKDELDRLVRLYEDARARYAHDPKRALAMATDPIGPLPKGADAAELAAWTVVGNVLLNLDEMFLKR